MPECVWRWGVLVRHLAFGGRGFPNNSLAKEAAPKHGTTEWEGGPRGKRRKGTRRRCLSIRHQLSTRGKNSHWRLGLSTEEEHEIDTSKGDLRDKRNAQGGRIDRHRKHGERVFCSATGAWKRKQLNRLGRKRAGATKTPILKMQAGVRKKNIESSRRRFTSNMIRQVIAADMRQAR